MGRRTRGRRGIVHGLVVVGQGEGGILPVEMITLPGMGRLRLTGSLGDVCALIFASNYAGVLTLLFPVLGDQRVEG